jgi:putative addiction module component (TIGR02574 family)
MLRFEATEVSRTLSYGRERARSTVFDMTQEISELLRRALELPSEARAALADSLLESLDETVGASAEEEWEQEIARRIGELDAETVRPVSWSEARHQMLAVLDVP